MQTRFEIEDYKDEIGRIISEFDKKMTEKQEWLDMLRKQVEKKEIQFAEDEASMEPIREHFEKEKKRRWVVEKFKKLSSDVRFFRPCGTSCCQV